MAVFYGFLVAACVKGRDPLAAIMTAAAVFLGLKMAASASAKYWYKVSCSGPKGKQSKRRVRSLSPD